MTPRTLDMANVIASDVTSAGDKTLSGDITFSGDVVPSTPLSNRNLIINGAMQVAQRASSATQVSNAAYATLDRWKFWENTDGSYQSSQVDITDLPGFTKAMLLSPNSADTSIGNSQYAFFGQLIEAQNLQHLSYSTSSAKTLTLSFYVKSNLTGKMTVYVAKYDNTTRIVPLEFDLPSSANTWERITLTVPALTESAAGVINNDNGMGLEFGWYLSAGNTYKVGTSGTWSSNSNGYSTANHNVNFMSSTDNNFYITGVQLELGDNATPFEHRTLQDELLRCQRYFYLVGGDSTGNQRNYIVGRTSNNNAMYCAPPSAVPMRSTPTVGNFSGSFNINCINKDGATNLNTQPTIDSYSYGKPGNTVGNMYLSGGSGLTDGRVCCARINVAMTFDSEL